MRDIVVSKVGGVLYWPDAVHKASSLADIYNSPAIVRYLFDKYPDRCIYLGRWQGTPPANFVGVSTDLKKVNEWDDEAQWDSIRTAVSDLEGHGVRDGAAWIDIAGSTPTTSLVDNPRGVSTVMSAAKYVGVLLGVCAWMRFNRITVVTDFRCYPQNFEMTFKNHGGVDWKHVKSKAVIGQEERFWSKKICGEKWNLRCMYGAVETWFQYGHKTEHLGYERNNDKCVIVAHSHMNDPRWSKGRDEIFTIIFEWLDEHGTDWEVIGNHWDRFSGYDRWRERFTGVVPILEVDKVYQTAGFGIVVPPAPHFATPKPFHHLRNGCIPLLWNERTLWYPPFVGFPIDSPFRIDRDKDPHDIVDHITRAQVDDVIACTKPNFNVLDKTIAAFTSDDFEFQDADEIFAEYGGYQRD